jgi:hypothetical protein
MPSNILLAALIENDNTTIIQSLAELYELEEEFCTRREARKLRREGVGACRNLDTLSDEIWKEQFR